MTLHFLALPLVLDYKSEEKEEDCAPSLGINGEIRSDVMFGDSSTKLGQLVALVWMRH